MRAQARRLLRHYRDDAHLFLPDWVVAFVDQHWTHFFGHGEFFRLRLEIVGDRGFIAVFVLIPVVAMKGHGGDNDHMDAQVSLRGVAMDIGILRGTRASP
jgi:hypothetical protein